MKKKVLILIYSLRRGGMEMAAIQFQTNMDPEKYEFIYYLQNADNNEKVLEDLVLSTGATFIEKPKEINSKYKEYKYLKKIISEMKIDIVHDHMNFHGGLSARAGYKAGASKRITHSHLTKDIQKIGITGKLYRVPMRDWIKRFGTDLLSCGIPSEKFLYGKNPGPKARVVNNGINTEKYAFNEEKRRAKRAELGIEDKFAIGHVGLIYWVKNQTFLIKVLNEMLKTYPNAVLLLVGELRDGGVTEELVKELGLQDKVKFLGTRSDVPELLMAIDILMFPSVFEGSPIVPVEAQATGLPVIISENVTRTIGLNENVEYLPIDETKENLKLWCNTAIELANGDRLLQDLTKLKHNYDIKNIAKQLEDIYLTF